MKYIVTLEVESDYDNHLSDENRGKIDFNNPDKYSDDEIHQIVHQMMQPFKYYIEEEMKGNPHFNVLDVIKVSDGSLNDASVYESHLKDLIDLGYKIRNHHRKEKGIYSNWVDFDVQSNSYGKKKKLVYDEPDDAYKDDLSFETLDERKNQHKDSILLDETINYANKEIKNMIKQYLRSDDAYNLISKVMHGLISSSLSDLEFSISQYTVKSAIEDKVKSVVEEYLADESIEDVIRTKYCAKIFEKLTSVDGYYSHIDLQPLMMECYEQIKGSIIMSDDDKEKVRSAIKEKVMSIFGQGTGLPNDLSHMINKALQNEIMSSFEHKDTFWKALDIEKGRMRYEVLLYAECIKFYDEMSRKGIDKCTLLVERFPDKLYKIIEVYEKDGVLIVRKGNLTGNTLKEDFSKQSYWKYIEDRRLHGYTEIKKADLLEKDIKVINSLLEKNEVILESFPGFEEAVMPDDVKSNDSAEEINKKSESESPNFDDFPF